MSEPEIDIAERIERLEEIAETLENGEVDLPKAKELREEADDHLEALRDALDVGDGDIIEIDGAKAELDS
ncbi:exodeoxyribonuclease VII small subunit [Halorubrum sp. RMP-47]|uniref:exodeoxyribonuclease VII small subunit n=1 Tax=Halorubrum miltondacostae TaxID=3076378 RepID=UPI0035277F78